MSVTSKSTPAHEIEVDHYWAAKRNEHSSVTLGSGSKQND